MTIMQMNAKMLSPVILKVTDSDNAALQIMASDMESDDMRDVDRYREETEYLTL